MSKLNFVRPTTKATMYEANATKVKCYDTSRGSKFLLWQVAGKEVFELSVGGYPVGGYLVRGWDGIYDVILNCKLGEGYVFNTVHDPNEEYKTEGLLVEDGGFKFRMDPSTGTIISTLVYDAKDKVAYDSAIDNRGERYALKGLHVNSYDFVNFKNQAILARVRNNVTEKSGPRRK